MALIPQPIFYRQLKRNDGGKRRNINVTNTDEADHIAKIADVVKPEWLELEGIYPGQEMTFPGGKKKTPIALQINTDHKFFPSDPSYDEPIRIEFEDGVIRDLAEIIESIVPTDREYLHNARWGDGNGHSHVRAALVGPSLTVPIADGRLMLGTWQQIVFIDYDNRARSRRVLVTVMGE